jgi:tetratricopeptide (TPR) repeat protein
MTLVALNFATPRAVAGEPAADAPTVDSSVAREAKELTRSGIAHYRAGNLEKARADFARAWALKPSVELAAGLAEVEMKLERYADAAEHWAYYLQNLPPDRTEAEYQLAECRKHLGSVRVAVDTDGALVLLDGKVLGAAPLRVDVWVTPGTHAFEAKVPGRAPAVQRVGIGAGEAQMVTLVLGAESRPREQTSPPAAAGNTERSSDAPKRSAAKTATLVTGGALALVGVGVGVGFTLKSNAAAKDAVSLRSELMDAAAGNPSSYCGNPGMRPELCDDYLGKLDDQDQARTIAIAGFATGGAFALATVVALFVWPDKSPSGQATLPRLTVSKTGGRGTFVALSGTF